MPWAVEHDMWAALYRVIAVGTCGESAFPIVCTPGHEARDVSNLSHNRLETSRALRPNRLQACRAQA